MNLAKKIVSVAGVHPARVKGARIAFPMNKIKGDTVEHKSGLRAETLEVSSPSSIIGENNTASAPVDADLPVRVEFLVLKKVKMTKKSNKRRQVWRGDVHLTSNPLAVGALNQAAGAEVFTADMALGAINTLIKIKK